MPNPSIAVASSETSNAVALIDLQTLIGALNVVLEPIVAAQTSAIEAMKVDINKKHEENNATRHKMRDDFATEIAQIQVDIINSRERVAALELKVSQAVGTDGTGGAIEKLKQGQVTQLDATRAVESQVSTLVATLNEFLPAMRALKIEQESAQSIRDRRDNAKSWAELVLKYGAVFGAIYTAWKHFH